MSVSWNVGSTDLGRLKAEALLETSENERDEDVESFADRLEHDKVERNSDERVEHAEDLAGRRLGRAVAVACHINQSTPDSTAPIYSLI